MFFAFPYFDQDAFMHHALHVLDAAVCMYMHKHQDTYFFKLLQNCGSLSLYPSVLLSCLLSLVVVISFKLSCF